MKNKQKSNHKYITSFLKKLHLQKTVLLNNYFIISSCKVLRGLTVVLVAIPHLGSAVFLCLKKAKNTFIKQKFLKLEYHQPQIFSQSCHDLICLPDTSGRFSDWRTNKMVHRYTPSFPAFAVYF